MNFKGLLAENPDRKLKVLISEPTFWDNKLVIPYVYVALKTYCDQNPVLKQKVQWLEPIFGRTDDLNLWKPYQNEQIDVLGLSCYEWNWDLQCRLAKRAKETNPECIVVAGGPQPDYKSKDFFLRHPEIDIVVVSEGEKPFREILLRLCNGVTDLTEIPGVFIASDIHPLPVSTNTTLQRFTDFDISPWIYEKDFLMQVCESRDNRHRMLIWETNRGCPYGCTFCDWGSSTMSKIRLFPMDRLTKEIEIFSQAKIDVLFIADSNFGIFDRDVEIAQMLAEAKSRTGFPKFIIYLPAKTNKENVFKISDIFHRNAMTSAVVLSLQHTDPEVLKAIKRINMSDKKLLELLQLFQDRNIPYMPQLIIGNPGDTYERWKDCLSKLLDMGMHEEIRSQNFALLPNAPASAPQYLQQWQIDIVKRYTICGTERRYKNLSKDQLTKTSYIVGTSTYSRQDWVHMHMYDTCLKTLHNGGLTRLLAIYARFSQGISYRHFYALIIEAFFAGGKHRFSELYTYLEKHRQNFLEDEEAFEEIEISDLKLSRSLYTTEEWLFYQIVENNFDLFYEELFSFVQSAFPQISSMTLGSLLQFQKDLIIRSDYDCRKGKTVEWEHDWANYFKVAQKAIQPLALESPQPFKSKRKFHISDKTTGIFNEIGLNWWTLEPTSVEARRLIWFERIMGPLHLRAGRTFFKAFRSLPENQFETGQNEKRLSQN